MVLSDFKRIKLKGILMLIFRGLIKWIWKYLKFVVIYNYLILL